MISDIGDDIDDALAITYAVNSGLDIVGITTVFRRAGLHAKMTSRLLKTLGHDYIPVFAGIDSPIRAPLQARENDRYDSQGLFIPCQYTSDMDSEAYDTQHGESDGTMWS